ncbi:hypothetical protein DHEL01_v212124 [Diaporthe helianthi]|uniref:Uncharacterized protein n=1 Tax=Diaporthe helianthi TaxID=158607 RepID=A0A2P5HGV1_DIAHE|nr:hypothetical protein DHEL01_v212124 [Diaporthe helianthi]
MPRANMAFRSRPTRSLSDSSRSAWTTGSKAGGAAARSSLKLPEANTERSKCLPASAAHLLTKFPILFVGSRSGLGPGPHMCTGLIQKTSVSPLAELVRLVTAMPPGHEATSRSLPLAPVFLTTVSYSAVLRTEDL